MMRDKILQVRAAGMILAAGLASMAVTSCSSQPRLVDNSPYASNSSIDGGYNPYPSDGGGTAHPGSLLPSHATTTTTHHQYTEAPPPPPTGYEAPAHQDKPTPSASSSTKRSSSTTASRSSTKKPTTSPAKATASKASPSKATASKTSTTKKSSGSSGGSYTVVKGDSLYAIARRKGTTVAKLKSANGLSGDLLSIGQKLKIP